MQSHLLESEDDWLLTIVVEGSNSFSPGRSTRTCCISANQWYRRSCAIENLNRAEVPYHSMVEESDFEDLIDCLTNLNNE